MRHIDAAALSGITRKAMESASDFASVVHNLIKDIRDSYRPQLHYMRGPGPKWRAKHQPRLRFDSETASLTWRDTQLVAIPARLSGDRALKSAANFSDRRPRSA
jgi:hypothetical protein